VLRIREEEGRLALSFPQVPDGCNRFWLNLPGTQGEHIFGGGEQFSTVDLKGREVPVWCQEQGVGRGHDLITFLADVTHGGAGGAWHTTYFPLPTFIGTTGWYCHVESPAYMTFDFRSDRRYQLTCWAVPERIMLGRRQEPLALLADLTELLGRQPRLPDWVRGGVWLGIQGGRTVVEQKLARARAAGVKVGAVWCQDWQGSRITSFGKQLMWNWRFSDALYPDLPGFATALRQEGVRFLGYINPFLALEGDLYREASAMGYLVRRRDGGEYHVTITTFPAAMLDLTNPAAVAWIKEVVRQNLLKAGLSGWMADFGEFLPADAVLYSGESAELYHNRYPAVWAQINQEAILEAGAGDQLFFCRAGYTGTSAHAPLTWAGDQLVNWSRDDGLATVIAAGLSLGLSGIGHTHADIGGYTTVAWIRRSKELFMRWAELAAFTPVMRTHEGNRPDANWQFDSDEETLAHFARMSQIHVALADYLRQAEEEYQRDGTPLMRHLWLHYPQDPVVPSLKYQYLLGRDLLVAPVIRRGASRVRLYLPEDRWIHLWSGREYKPGWQTVPAPLGQPPVFCRAESEVREMWGKGRRTG
jgi:sulfoquinovosidase